MREFFVLLKAVCIIGPRAAFHTWNIARKSRKEGIDIHLVDVYPSQEGHANVQFEKEEHGKQ